jgi:hypothetical protein
MLVYLLSPYVSLQWGWYHTAKHTAVIHNTARVLGLGLLATKPLDRQFGYLGG